MGSIVFLFGPGRDVKLIRPKQLVELRHRVFFLCFCLVFGGSESAEKTQRSHSSSENYSMDLKVDFMDIKQRLERGLVGQLEESVCDGMDGFRRMMLMSCFFVFVGCSS